MARSHRVAARLIVGLGIAAALIASDRAFAISHSYTTGPKPPAGSPIDTRVFPQAGDYLSGVGWLVGNSSSCSSTAITPTVLLTAAHCWAAANSVNFPIYDSSGKVTVVTRDVTGFAEYPGYNRNSSSVQRNDIALAFLDTPLPSSVRTYSLASVTNPGSVLGAGVSFAGYGIVLGGNDTSYTRSVRSETFYDPNQNGYYYVPQLRGGVNRIESFSGTTFLTDFDPIGNASGFGSLEVGTTQGDSGSGVFFSVGESLRLACVLDPSRGFCSIPQKPTSDVPTLIGVTSFSSSIGCGKTDLACMNRFGTKDGYTFIGPYIDWITSVAAGVTTSTSAVDYSDPRGTSLFDFEPSAFQPLDPLPVLPVPEPTTGALLMLGLLSLALPRRN